MKLGVGIISLGPCGRAGTAQWLRGSVCISRTMCTKPCKSAETAPARMLWRLSSGRPGLPACIPAVHTYGRVLDCADGLMSTAELTWKPPQELCESAAQTRSWQAIMPARVALRPLGLLPSP